MIKKFKFKKKGQVSVGFLGNLIISLIAFFIILFLAKSIACVIVNVGEDASCQWSLLISSSTRTAGFSAVPIECKSKQTVVNLDRLNQELDYASNRLKKINKLKYLEKDPSLSVFQIDKSKPDESSVYEFVIDKIIADEMKSCWDKVWKGGLPLFDEWYNLIDFNGFSDSSINSGSNNAVSPADFLTKYNGFEISKGRSLFTVYGPPTFCVVCSTLKFDAEVKAKIWDKLKDTKINSLTEWMKINPVPFNDKQLSYFEYLKEGQSVKGALFEPNYGEIDLNKQQAIVFRRINPHFLDENMQNIFLGAAGYTLTGGLGGALVGTLIGEGLDAAGWSLVEKTKPINNLMITDYDKVTLPLDPKGLSEGETVDKKRGNCLYVFD